VTYAAFSLNGFDDGKRNLTFVKTDFQVLKFKFRTCNFKQAFYPFRRLYIAWLWHTILLYKLFVRYLVVKPECVSAALVDVFQWRNNDDATEISSCCSSSNLS